MNPKNEKREGKEEKYSAKMRLNPSIANLTQNSCKIFNFNSLSPTLIYSKPNLRWWEWWLTPLPQRKKNAFIAVNALGNVQIARMGKAAKKTCGSGEGELTMASPWGLPQFMPLHGPIVLAFAPRALLFCLITWPYLPRS